MASLGASFLPDKIQKRFILIVSTYTTSTALFLVAPSKLLNFPDDMKISALGLCLTGLFNPIISIAAGTEMRNVAVKDYEKHPDISHHVSNLAAGVYNSMLAYVCVWLLTRI